MNGIGCVIFWSEILAIFICHVFAFRLQIFLLKLATMSSAKAVTKQLLASQKFLIGLRSLPSYGEIEGKQAIGLLQVIDKGGNLSSDQAASVLQSLDEQVWSEANLNKIKERLASKTIAFQVDTNVRRANQDYLFLPNFLTAQHWQKIQDSTENRDAVIQTITSHAGVLGLRCPNEQTYAMIVTLGYISDLTAGKLNSQQKYQLLSQRKPQLRKFFSQLPPPTLYLECLPSLPEELPEQVFNEAFREKMMYVPSPFNVTNLLHIAKSFPLRMTNLDVQPVHTGRVQTEDTSAGAAGFGQALTVLAASVLRSNTDSSTSSGLSGLQILNPPVSQENASSSAGLPVANTARQAIPPLALEDSSVARLEDVEKEVFSKQKKDKPSGLSVSSALDALKAEVDPEESEGEKATGRKTVSKRPASKSSQQCFKRPAQKKSMSTVKKLAGKHAEHAVKRPAKKGKGGVPTKVESKAEQKKRLLRQIPPAKLREFRHGCATCRFTPNCCMSCWKKRGYSL